MLAEQLLQAAGGTQICGVLGQKVAAHLVGHAHVAQHQAQDILVNIAAADKPHGQDAQPFLKCLRHAVYFLRTRRGTTHVHLMGGTGNVSDQPSGLEHGHDLKTIGEVPRTHEAVVQ